jgi:hypothetical protein
MLSVRGDGIWSVLLNAEMWRKLGVSGLSGRMDSEKSTLADSAHARKERAREKIWRCEVACCSYASDNSCQSISLNAEMCCSWCGLGVSGSEYCYTG